MKERDISLGIGCVDREVGAIGRLINNWFIKSSVECETDFVKRKRCLFIYLFATNLMLCNLFVYLFINKIEPMG